MLRRNSASRSAGCGCSREVGSTLATAIPAPTASRSWRAGPRRGRRWRRRRWRRSRRPRPVLALDAAARGAAPVPDLVLPGPGGEAAEIIVDGGEIHDHAWVSPAEMMAAATRARSSSLLPPG